MLPWTDDKRMATHAMTRYFQVTEHGDLNVRLVYAGGKCAAVDVKLGGRSIPVRELSDQMLRELRETASDYAKAMRVVHTSTNF